MDPEFQRLVDAAAEVAATGRWNAVNERIKNLAASPGPDNAPHMQLLGCLCSRLFSEYLLLKRAYGDESERDSITLLTSMRAIAIYRQSADCLSASVPSIPLQQSASLYCQLIQSHLQFRYGRADFWMLSDLLLQRLENLVSTFNMRFCLGRT
jgi:hypothetical protein